MVLPQSCTKTIKLNNGAHIPQIGLGTWRSSTEQCYNAVKTALQDGYRHIDTARGYENEESVGKAINDFIKESGVPRKDIFVTTKMWCTDFQDPVSALKASLERLGLSYVDLYLMHWPCPMAPSKQFVPVRPDGKRDLLPFDKWNYIDTYKAMQQLITLKLTKAIGISNFNIPKIQALLDDKDIHIVPACLQVEIHPYLPQIELVDFCQSKGIQVEAYSPLGSLGAPLLKDQELRQIATKYGVSVATVIMSWDVQRGIIIIPKSVNPTRVISNRKVITLSSEDMKAINDIHKTYSKRFVAPDWGVDVFNSDAKFN